MLEKEKRVVDKELLHFIRYNCPCVACGIKPEEGVDPHHLKTVKTGGSDELNNILPTCRLCHTKIHQMGLNEFTKKYSNVKAVLISKGWYYDDLQAKWKRDLDQIAERGIDGNF